MRFTLRGISISGSLSFLFLLFLTAQFAHILLVRDLPVFFFLYHGPLVHAELISLSLHM